MEMNMHIPQSIEARTEALIAACVARHIMTPQSNGPIMGVFQNGLIGSYLLTNEWTEGCTRLIQAEAAALLMAINASVDRINQWKSRAYKVYPEDFDKDEYTGHVSLGESVSGKCLISILFPENMKWDRKTDVNEKYPNVRIKNGILLKKSGPLCGASLNKGGACIVAHIANYYGEERACQFLTEACRITDAYLPLRGFSVGYSDCLSTRDEKVKTTLNKAIVECQAIIASTKPGQDREMMLNNTLNNVMNFAPMFASRYAAKGERNGFIIMKKSGAKGSDVNFSQISAFVGQQNTDGQRPEKRLSNESRCQSCFQSGDDSPAARGFIQHSYLKGLTPSEMFFHASSARRGVTDTSVKTAESGYTSKKMGKKEEDLMIYRDGSLRDATGKIVQFLSGDDGMNPTKLKNVRGVTYPFFVDFYVLADLVSHGSSAKRRKLTEEEVETILQFIIAACEGVQHLEPVHIASRNMQDASRPLLHDITVASDRVVEMCKATRHHIETTKALYGDMTGLIAACCMSEVATQLTLNIHRAIGRSDVDITLGLPKLKQYINASKKQTKPSCHFCFSGEITDKLTFLKKSPVDDDPAMTLMSTIGDKLACMRLKDLIIKGELLAVDESSQEELPLSFMKYERYTDPWWNDYYTALEADTREPSEWVLRLTLDLKKMYVRRLSLEDIRDRAQRDCLGIARVTRSPLIDAQLEVHICSAPLLKEFKSLLKNDTYTEGNISYFALRDVVLRTLRETIVDGIENINKVVVTRNSESTLVGQTQGTDLAAILRVRGIDQTSAISDDIWDVYRTLGIEAARVELLNNLERIVSFGGSYINRRHYQVIADRLTHTGTLSGANHTGLDEYPPISRILFERPVNIFTDCCTFACDDTMTGLAAAVMFGKAAKIGASTVDIKNMENEPVM